MMKQPASSKQRERFFRTVPPPATNGQATAPPNGTPAPAGDGKPPRPDSGKRRQLLRQYIDWLWPYRRAILALFLLALASAAADMVWPLFVKGIIDKVLPGREPIGSKLARLNGLAAGVLILLTGKQAVDSFRDYRTGLLNARVIFRIRRRLYNALLRLPLTTLGEMKSGGIVSRLSGDVDSVSGLVQMAVISPGVAIIRVVLTMGVLFWLSWRLALAAMIMLPPLAVVSLLWLRKVRPVYRSIRDDNAVIDGRVTETFGGIRVVRAFRREPREERGYAVGHHTIIRKRLFAQRLEMVLEAVWGLLIPGTSLLIVWYGGRLVLRNPPQAQVGDIFAFQIYAVLLLQPVWQIVNSMSQTQKSLAAMERVFEVLQTPADKPDAPDAVPADGIVRELRLNHVGFEYRPGHPVLSDITLRVPGGSTVALVGPSGAGKTTLTDLIARFHDPTSGSISLNGTDLRQLQLQSYRNLLAIVQQETFLFDGTIRENIAYGRRGATDAQITDAARRANAHTFITQLPDGYDTDIGERGFKLSGGQKQRLSIARAILADPQILILDEATSNLDTESEQLIQAALSELLHDRTTFVIAHRLSTITQADIIVVLDQGRIAEKGTHAELMERRGAYFEMVERQRRSFAAEESASIGFDSTGAVIGGSR